MYYWEKGEQFIWLRSTHVLILIPKYHEVGSSILWMLSPSQNKGLNCSRNDSVVTKWKLFFLSYGLCRWFIDKRFLRTCSLEPLISWSFAVRCSLLANPASVRMSFFQLGVVGRRNNPNSVGRMKTRSIHSIHLRCHYHQVLACRECTWNLSWIHPRTYHGLL